MDDQHATSVPARGVATSPVGRVVAVVLCAGQGTRMGAEGNKVFLPLGGVPIVVHAIRALERSRLIDDVVLVAHPREVEACRALAEGYGLRKVALVIPGGPTRHQSEYCALNALRERIERAEVAFVLVHDGARPFVSPREIAGLIQAAREEGGALLAEALASGEIVARVDAQDAVVEVYSPDRLWRAQTPQAFAAPVLLAAYDAAARDGFNGTDTASSVERMGQRVRVVAGNARNLKITTPDDLARAEALLRHSRHAHTSA